MGYGYFIDFEPGQSVPVTASHKTLGLRFDGAATTGRAKWLYTAEYVRQSDYGDGSSAVDADYVFGVFGVNLAGVQLKLGYELPSGRLVDTTFSVGGTVAGINLQAVYHDYASDNLGFAYGKELNLLAAWKPTKQLTLLAKYADYRGDSNAIALARNVALTRDITKTWLQVDYLF